MVSVLFMPAISFAGVNGDVNNDGIVDEADINAVVFHILARATAAGSADCNGDKIMDVGDVVYLMNSLFKELPPDPRDIATELNPNVATNFAESIEFLFMGPNPVQTEVTTGSIESRRSGVIRGRVIGLDSHPQPRRY